MRSPQTFEARESYPLLASQLWAMYPLADRQPSAEALRYLRNRWDALQLYLSDGRCRSTTTKSSS